MGRLEILLLGPFQASLDGGTLSGFDSDKVRALLTYLATPFFLDSRWALLPAVFLTIVLVIRTSLEDKTLQDVLEGYRAYAERVRYRLLPGVW